MLDHKATEFRPSSLYWRQGPALQVAQHPFDDPSSSVDLTIVSAGQTLMERRCALLAELLDQSSSSLYEAYGRIKSLSSGTKYWIPPPPWPKFGATRPEKNSAPYRI